MKQPPSYPVRANRNSQRAVVGFVVRREEIISPPGAQVVQRKRTQVGRVFHSRDAAETMVRLLKKEFPTHDYYVHERTKNDDSEIT